MSGSVLRTMPPTPQKVRKVFDYINAGSTSEILWTYEHIVWRYEQIQEKAPGLKNWSQPCRRE